uniref:Yippee domain-containing protein n=1 Tax=Spongospora subterranea TaxID=70186 RepID=A0A0H5RAP2_9EUKA|eukprot:CRZ05539.1 hypothetical protein [Spongospora subterranea]
MAFLALSVHIVHHSQIPLGPMDDYIDKWVIKSKTKQVGKTPVEENTPMASRNAPTQPPLFAPSENDYLMDNQHIDMLDLTTNSSPRQASMRASSLNQFAYKRNLVQPLSPISPPPKNCLLPTPSAKISSANYNVHPTCEDEVHGLISTTAADHSVPSLNKETQRFGINARESASSVGANAPTLQCRSCCADLWPTPRYTILNNARIEMQSVVSCLGMHSTIDLLPMEGFNSIRVVFVVESNSNKQGMIRMNPDQIYWSKELGLALRSLSCTSCSAAIGSEIIAAATVSGVKQHVGRSWLLAARLTIGKQTSSVINLEAISAPAPPLNIQEPPVARISNMSESCQRSGKLKVSNESIQSESSILPAPAAVLPVTRPQDRFSALRKSLNLVPGNTQKTSIPHLTNETVHATLSTQRESTLPVDNIPEVGQNVTGVNASSNDFQDSLAITANQVFQGLEPSAWIPCKKFRAV